MQTLKTLYKKITIVAVLTVTSVVLWPGTAAAGSIGYEIRSKEGISCKSGYRVGVEVNYLKTTTLGSNWHDAGDKPYIYRSSARKVKYSTKYQNTTLSTNSRKVNNGSLGYAIYVSASHPSEQPSLRVVRAYCQPLI